MEEQMQTNLLDLLLAPFGALLNVLLTILLAPVRFFFPEF